MKKQSALHFFGTGGMPRRKKKPKVIVESDTEEAVATRSSQETTPSKTRSKESKDKAQESQDTKQKDTKQD